MFLIIFFNLGKILMRSRITLPWARPPKSSEGSATNWRWSRRNCSRSPAWPWRRKKTAPAGVRAGRRSMCVDRPATCPGLCGSRTRSPSRTLSTNFHSMRFVHSSGRRCTRRPRLGLHWGDNLRRINRMPTKRRAVLWPAVWMEVFQVSYPDPLAYAWYVSLLSFSCMCWDTCLFFV